MYLGTRENVSKLQDDITMSLNDMTMQFDILATQAFFFTLFFSNSKQCCWGMRHCLSALKIHPLVLRNNTRVLSAEKLRSRGFALLPKLMLCTIRSFRSPEDSVTAEFYMGALWCSVQPRPKLFLQWNFEIVVEEPVLQLERK